MKLGIVGLPNVGKSTLFNAITNAGAEAANYPFCTIEPNVGTVAVPDKRLDRLAEMYQPEKYTPATIEFVDIAGLVKGASKGEGLGNKFLSHIREVDALVHVVRCFEDSDVVHVDGVVGPRKDIEVIDLELIFSDLEILDRRLDKVAKLARTDKKYLAEQELLQNLKAHLEEGQSVRSFPCTSEERELIAQSPFLSLKPVLFAANLSDQDFMHNIDTNPHYQEVKQIAAQQNAGVLPICAQLEEEIADMSLEDKQMFLGELGLEESGLDRLIRESYRLLGLISFLTAGKPEVRAWTITKGTKAPQAAVKFIPILNGDLSAPEVVAFEDLMDCGSLTVAKEKGLVRSEGKEYVMQDGDVVLFRFNV